jgi:metallo-beta-lactamase family protein
LHLQFNGAAREVTGSCHVLRTGRHTILLDCGLFQGRRRESDIANRSLPLPVAEIDGVLLSHAHIDHAGRLPMLSAGGFARSIWCTAATRDLCGIMLADSARIQERDAEFLAKRKRDFIEPLYNMADAARVVELMVGVPYDRAMEVLPGVQATFLEAGHILGSASVVVEVEQEGHKTRIAFSGDIGRSGLAIIRDPKPPENADIVIMESTYGNRDHESLAGSREHLARVVSETAARGGRILIPAFAVGRTQELLYELHALAREQRIPAIPIFVDSPLAISATAIFGMHPYLFDRSEDLVQEAAALFDHPLVRYTRAVEESKAINAMRGPCVIIAAAGMVESGRILHHLAHGASDPRNTVLIVGFQAEHTLGRRIVERSPMIRVFGEEIPLRAQVEVINGYSAHADRGELIRWLDAVRRTSPGLRKVLLVHGEPQAQDALAGALTGRGYQVHCPARGEEVQI